MCASFSGVLSDVGEHSQEKTVFSPNYSWYFATFSECLEWKTKDRLTDTKHTYLNTAVRLEAEWEMQGKHFIGFVLKIYFWV